MPCICAFFLWDSHSWIPATMLRGTSKLGSLGILLCLVWQVAADRRSISPKHICEGSSPSRWFQSPDITPHSQPWIFPSWSLKHMELKDKALCCNLKEFMNHRISSIIKVVIQHYIWGYLYAVIVTGTGAFQTVCFWTSISFPWLVKLPKALSHLLVASLLCNWQIHTSGFPF